LGRGDSKYKKEEEHTIDGKKLALIIHKGKSRVVKEIYTVKREKSVKRLEGGGKKKLEEKGKGKGKEAKSCFI